MSRPLRRPPRMPEPSAVPVVAGGTLLWALVGVVLWLGRHSGWMAGHHRWLQICAAGVGLGVAGVAYCVWRERRLSRCASAASCTDSTPDSQSEADSNISSAG